ncbi:MULTISPECIES: hypothetical protein [unclassified Bacteroides]|uniref:hypothetical protein n=1 Tax=unclassified Bacteroides TaxID=2646097 RepID=UPI0004E226DA|nr:MULTISPECIES: hypothetical protein [unclassified Bacteroides]
MNYKDLEALKKAVKFNFTASRIGRTDHEKEVLELSADIAADLFSYGFPFYEFSETLNKIVEFYFVQCLKDSDATPLFIDDFERFSNEKRMISTAFRFLEALQTEYWKREKKEESSGTEKIIFN